MICVAVNELLYDKNNNRYYRVLWLDEGYIVSYIIDVKDEKALPFLCLTSVIHEKLEEEVWRKERTDPFISWKEPRNDKEKALRDQAWEIISSLVNIEPEIFKRNTRGRLINNLMEKVQITKPRIYRMLRKYWQRGQTQNALIPDYEKRGWGRKGEISYTKKTGRPRKDKTIGVNIDKYTLEIIKKAASKYYLGNKRATVKHAYEMMIKEYFGEYYYYENGVRKTIIQEKNKIPTIRQFRYHLKKLFSEPVIIEKREGSKKFQREYREKVGSALKGVSGPGARFEIDATVGNVYLVSRFNQAWGIGRPIVYFVIDVYTRMIVGMHVGIDHPSWQGASMAMINTAQDKIDFCGKYGIEITEEQWPSSHMPKKFLADRGEVLYKGAKTIIEGLGIGIDHTASYRAEMKGTVEQSFAAVDATLKPFLPGYIDTDFKERGGEDYRKRAMLTVEQYTKIIIYFILFHNSRYMKEYKLNKEMIEDNISAIPIDLWKWGIKNRSGKLYSFSHDLVRFYLLPRVEATVTQKGIKFKRMYYTCSTAINEQWFSKAAIKGNWKIKASYNPRNMNHIYIHTEDEKHFEQCELLEKDSAYRDKWLEELEQLWDKQNERVREKEHEQLQAKINFISEMESVIKEAKQKEKQYKSVSTRMDKTKNIQINRTIEKTMNHIEEIKCSSKNEEEISRENLSPIPLSSKRKSVRDMYERRLGKKT
ncbi:TPA: DDE-type integrase/transposase/recombinase [Bacillus pseudomycoides]|nr:DDE-type integrase/transposase/recombinase [Bacillus pseudomycoides]